jgi:hypothetical protein
MDPVLITAKNGEFSSTTNIFSVYFYFDAYALCSNATVIDHMLISYYSTYLNKIFIIHLMTYLMQIEWNTDHLKRCSVLNGPKNSSQ